jgi:hypothetical protein
MAPTPVSPSGCSLIRWPSGRVGSSPAFGTTAKACPDGVEQVEDARGAEAGGRREGGGGAVSGPADASPLVRVDPVPARLQRQTGAGVARAPLPGVHARHLRPPAPGRPPGARLLRQHLARAAGGRGGRVNDVRAEHLVRYVDGVRGAAASRQARRLPWSVSRRRCSRRRRTPSWWLLPRCCSCPAPSTASRC